MKKELLKFVTLLAVALGAAPAYSAFWQWSKTAGSNASADPTINFAEGMSPSSVNDSARALMARAAEYRDDISGLLVAGGTATAFTVTTNQGLPSTPNNGQMISLRVPLDNGVNPTLSADGGGAFPIVSVTCCATPAIPAATLIAGNPYTLMFSTASGGVWEVHGFYGNALTVPLGGMIPYTLATVPNSNFVFPAGQCLSTITYATYWVAKGSPASGSCPGGQFAIIDMRGYVPAGLDTMPGSGAASRLTSSATGCGSDMNAIGATCGNGVEGATIPVGQLPSISSSGSNSISVTSQFLLIDATGVLLDFNPANASGFRTPNNTASLRLQTSSGSNSISVTSTGTTGTARPQVQPTIAVTYLLRVI